MKDSRLSKDWRVELFQSIGQGMAYERVHSGAMSNARRARARERGRERGERVCLCVHVLRMRECVHVGVGDLREPCECDTHDTKTLSGMQGWRT